MAEVATAAAIKVSGLVFSFILNKLSSKASEFLHEGDVFDQQLRQLIIGDLNEIKSQLQGLSEKDLKTSLTKFREGTIFLSHYLDEIQDNNNERQGLPDSRHPQDDGDCSGRASNNCCRSGNFEKARECFKEAETNAVEALNTSSLKICDRVLAMQIRVLSFMLKNSDTRPGSADSWSETEVCCEMAEELNRLSQVRKAFFLHDKKNREKSFLDKVRGTFAKAEREKLVTLVLGINYVVWRFECMRRKRRLPPKYTIFALNLFGKRTRSINPIFYPDKLVLTEVLRLGKTTENNGNSDVQRDENLLLEPIDFAVAKEHFVILDAGDRRLKVFTCFGEFVRSLNLTLEGNASSHGILVHTANRKTTVYILKAKPSQVTHQVASVEGYDLENGDLTFLRDIGRFDPTCNILFAIDAKEGFPLVLLGNRLVECTGVGVREHPLRALRCRQATAMAVNPHDGNVLVSVCEEHQRNYIRSFRRNGKLTSCEYKICTDLSPTYRKSTLCCSKGKEGGILELILEQEQRSDKKILWVRILNKHDLKEKRDPLKITEEDRLEGGSEETVRERMYGEYSWRYCMVATSDGGCAVLDRDKGDIYCVIWPVG